MLDSKRTNSFRKSCIECSCLSNEILAQVMADLTSETVSASRSFSYTEIDLAVPITSKSNHKTYIAVFPFATKGNSFGNSPRLGRFLHIGTEMFQLQSRSDKKILSDNGTNFFGARNDIIKIHSLFSKGN